jgi:hypothetical protein
LHLPHKIKVRILHDFALLRDSRRHSSPCPCFATGSEHKRKYARGECADYLDTANNGTHSVTRTVGDVPVYGVQVEHFCAKRLGKITVRLSALNVLSCDFRCKFWNLVVVCFVVILSYEPRSTVRWKHLIMSVPRALVPLKF